MMKLLLVGGSGLLSGEVAKLALSRGFEVTMVNRGKRNVFPYVTLIKTDKQNFTYIKSQLGNQKYDAVIDFLCYTAEDLKDSFSFYSNFTKQYFLISSCAVYDKSTIHRKHIETDPKPLSIWSYSVNKWKCENALRDLAEKSDCNYTIVRPSITYGNTRIPYGIAPQYGYHWTLAARVLSGKPIIRWKEGKTRYNMLRVEDFAVGLIGLIGNQKAYNEDFNICSDETPSFNDVLNAIEKALNHKIERVDIDSEFYAKECPSRAGEILGGRSKDELNSNEKIKKVVPDFKQTIGLEEGVRMTIEAYRQQSYQNGIDWRFDAETDRIIKKWCVENHIGNKMYNLKFIDYLGTASIKDRMQYWLEFYKNQRFRFLCLRIINKLVR